MNDTLKKCNVYIHITPKQIFKWLNSLNTQHLAYRLLSLYMMSNFENRLLICIPIGCEKSSGQDQYIYYRLFSLYFQNSIISRNPLFLDEAINSFLKFLNIISKIDKNLESHIMLQPWVKILMESRLEKIDNMTWKLIEKWLSFNKVNASLIGVIQQFANKLLSINAPTEEERSCISKLSTGIYAKFLSEETRNYFKLIDADRIEVSIEEDMDLVSQVQNIITNYVNPS